MKPTWQFFGALIVTGSIFLLLRTPTRANSENVITRMPATQNVSKSPALRTPSNPKTASVTQAVKNKNQQEIASLEDMARVLSLYSQPHYDLPGLIDYLQKSSEAPFIARDANPDTGEMIIVRTKAPLPGTRYFHAQYFTSEGGKPMAQHISFEYKPGPTAMKDAAAAVEKAFTNLRRPRVETPDFVQWDLDEDHILWIKKMGEDDLREDPFNAYSAADTGTVRVAIELEIHDKEDSH